MSSWASITLTTAAAAAAVVVYVAFRPRIEAWRDRRFLARLERVLDRMWRELEDEERDAPDTAKLEQKIRSRPGAAGRIDELTREFHSELDREMQKGGKP